MPHSLLIMLFGQSNADAHNAGPVMPSPCLQNPKVVVPNDGRGFQGWRGRARDAAITGFEPSFNPRNKIQSIGAAMGCALMDQTADEALAQVIVRSAARGGAPLQSRDKNGRRTEGIYIDENGAHAPVFRGLIEDVRQIAEAAEAGGAPLKHIYIPFFHGEADRSLERDDYERTLHAMMDDAEAAFAAMGLTCDWLLTQASGTGIGANGNAWENRLCLVDVAAQRENAHLAAANYAYELADSVHLAAESKALVGEALARQVLNLEAGRAVQLSRLVHTIVTGRQIELLFDSRTGLTLDTTQFDEPDAPFGFSVTGQPGQTIRRVEQTGPASIRITCDLPVDSRAAQVNYAFEKREGCANQERINAYPVGRGCLREDWSEASRIVPGRDIHAWVPAFSVALESCDVFAMAA